MIHARKIDHEYFEAVISGKKSFEVRREDQEQCFLVGDLLALNEVGNSGFPGRACLVEITYVLRDPKFVRDGFCVLGIRPCYVTTGSEGEFMASRSPYQVPLVPCPAGRGVDL